MTRPLDPGSGYFTVLRSVFGVWPGLKRSPIQGLASGLMIYASQVVQALAIVLAGAVLLLTPKDIAEQLLYGAGSGASTTLSRVFEAAVPSVFEVAAVVALLLLAAGLRNAGRFLSRQSFEKQVGRDKRAPILFLRAFKDDQAVLPRGGFFHRLLRAELGQRRLDHLLVEEFARFGPIVALGRPGQRIRPFGAARVYVGHENWQARVTELAEKARHIVLVADEGPGVEWEIETMATSPFQAKTMFLTAQRGGDLRACAQLQPQLNAVKVHSAAKVIAAFHRSDGGSTVFHTAKPTPESYVVALQAFFRRDQRPVVQN
jgi:hypothetical protein